MTLLRQYLVSVTLSFLFFAKTIRTYSNEANRFFAHWDIVDALALSLGCLAIGTTGFCLFQFVERKCGVRARRLLRHGFLLAAGAALMIWLPLHRLPNPLVKALVFG